MKTLGDYSKLCQKLDQVLRDVAEGKEIINKSITLNYELFILDSDGMV